jgi:hypothetical protein
MPDERWNELFAALRTNRGRAILALAVSNGARASEILGSGARIWTGVREWQEFQQHFELRKLELGTCGRPYGTPANMSTPA